MALNIKYPLFRARLLTLMEEDQKARDPKAMELLMAKSDLTEHEWIEPDRIRARELLEILGVIKTPSVKNIGLDGARAAWLIAQHNIDYLNLGNIMLKKMRYIFNKDKSQVYYQGIPYLIDRLKVQKNNWNIKNKQLYGTQAYVDEQGKIHQYPVINKCRLAERLSKYDLDIERACIVNE